MNLKLFLKRNWELFLIFFLLIVIFSYFLERYYYVGDPLAKVYQSYSLIFNNYQSEEILYRFREFDPEFRYFPLTSIVTIPDENKVVGVFPVLFSLIIAPVIEFNGVKYLPVLTTIVNFLSLYLLKRYWNFSSFWILFFLFGTFLFLNSIDMSESSLLVALQVMGLTLLFRGGDRWVVLSAFILTLGMWLRLEMLLFLMSLIFVWFLLENEIVLRDFDWRGIGVSRKFVVFVVSVVLFVLVFFLFHWYQYGHILGPRYLANIYVEEYSILRQLKHLWILLFFGSFNQLGFFGYVPLLVVLLIFLFWRREFDFPREELILIYSGILLVILVGITPMKSPNFQTKYIAFSHFSVCAFE
ncbi:MAG: hypothetical protein RMI35_09605 [Leptospiraceae bacterium]|nr:hypothetical protein [Leptospiraceae bacterium]